jgi:hypothetical protein
VSTDGLARTPPPLTDLLDAVEERQRRISNGWSDFAALNAKMPALDRLLDQIHADRLSASCPEGTAWALVAANVCEVQLIQPGVTPVAGLDVAVLEPVLLTGAGLARVAAVLNRQGARSVHGIVGELLGHASAEALSLTTLSVLG